VFEAKDAGGLIERVHETRLEDNIDQSSQGVFRPIRDGRQQIIGELTTSRCGELKERPRLAQPVDPRCQRRVYRVRNHFGRQTTDQLPRVLPLDERARFHD